MSTNFPPLKIANLVRISTMLLARSFTPCRLLGLNMRAFRFKANGQWPAIDPPPEVGGNYFPQNQSTSP